MVSFEEQQSYIYNFDADSLYSLQYLNSSGRWEFGPYLSLLERDEAEKVFDEMNTTCRIVKLSRYLAYPDITPVVHSVHKVKIVRG